MMGCGAGAGRLRRVSSLRGIGRGAAPGKSPREREWEPSISQTGRASLLPAARKPGGGGGPWEWQGAALASPVSPETW